MQAIPYTNVKGCPHTPVTYVLFVCWSLTSLCHSNGHIETMSAREINPCTALTRIRYQFLRTQWSTSNHSEWTRLRIRPLSHRGWHQLHMYMYQLYGYSNPCTIMNAFTPHNTSTLCSLWTFCDIKLMFANVGHPEPNWEPPRTE